MGFHNSSVIIDGNYIKKLRLDTKLNHSDFANMLGVSGTTILNWEANKSYPSQLHIANLMQLRNKVDNFKKNNANDDVGKVLTNVLIAGGIAGILFWLFKQD